MQVPLSRESRTVPVQRYEFFKDRVIYVSTWPGALCAFCSIHKMGGMSKEAAKKAFHREHTREVMEQVAQKMREDAKMAPNLDNK